MSDLISVLMSTFNRADLIEYSINSILGSGQNIDLIVVIDGSTDNTESILAKFGERIRWKSIQNSGKSGGLNAALEMARGEFVIVADDDDFLIPEALNAHLAALKENPNAAFTYSPIYRGISGPSGTIKDRKLFASEDVPADRQFAHLLFSMYFALQGCVLRTRHLREIGAFDLKMIRSQDYEMLLRLLRIHSGVFVNAPISVVRGHNGTRGASSERFSAGNRAIRGMKYLTEVYDRLYHELSLAEYLPRSRADNGWTALIQREALFRRMSVMMRKGVWKHALHDLRDIVENHMAIGPISPTEREACQRAMGNPPSVLDLHQNREVLRILRQILPHPAARTISRHLLKGAYWASREMTRDHNFWLAAEMLGPSIRTGAIVEFKRLIA
ncbi:MAG TPA: glycosyltransferase family 2 protein [Rhizomicrobium sp.]|nr:glycosyltransferase family 2 protein [Rhizomicrobium sp.]